RRLIVLLADLTKALADAAKRILRQVRLLANVLKDRLEVHAGPDWRAERTVQDIDGRDRIEEPKAKIINGARVRDHESADVPAGAVDVGNGSADAPDCPRGRARRAADRIPKADRKRARQVCHGSMPPSNARHPACTHVG